MLVANTSGLLITFEGGEGAGKTTLMERIYQELTQKGRRVVKTREPGGSRLSEKIRTILLDPELMQGEKISPDAEVLLFLAARAQHIQQLIRPALEQGKVILCDRFNDSTIAYQGIARGLGEQRVAQLCSWVCNGIDPHLTLLLDIDPLVGLTRAKRVSGSPDRMEAEAIAFHQKVRKGFQQLAKSHPERIKLIDAAQTPDRLFEEAMHLLGPILA